MSKSKKNEVVTVCNNINTVKSTIPTLDNSRLGPVLSAIVNTFGGKLVTRQDINNLFVYTLMQNKNYNKTSKKYNGDQNDPSNAKLEAAKATAVMKQKGLIIPLS